ncbi:MAG TPA: hypothetical protein VFA12_02335 [Stellaceae bacterium]|nr:hypothetical protein [Stellaceae bacterium]
MRFLPLAAAMLLISPAAMAQSTLLSALDNPNAARSSGIGATDGPLGITGASSNPKAWHNVTVTTIEGGRIVSYEGPYETPSAPSPATTPPAMQYVPYGGRW